MHPLTRKLIIFTPNTQRQVDLGLESSPLSPGTVSRLMGSRRDQESRVREAAEAFLSQYGPHDVASNGDALPLVGGSELDGSHIDLLSYFTMPENALNGGLLTITDASDMEYADLGVDVPLEIDAGIADEDLSFFFNMEDASASEGERSGYDTNAAAADTYTSEADSAILEAELFAFASDSDSDDVMAGLTDVPVPRSIAATSQKRKASEEPIAEGHKRHRSITDVRAISLASDA